MPARAPWADAATTRTRPHTCGPSPRLHRSAGRCLSPGLSDDTGFGHWAPSARDLDVAFAAITASSDYPYGRPHRRSSPTPGSPSLRTGDNLIASRRADHPTRRNSSIVPVNGDRSAYNWAARRALSLTCSITRCDPVYRRSPLPTVGAA